MTEENIKEKADDTPEFMENDEQTYLVKINDEYVELRTRKDDNYPYEIELDRINDKDDILEWIYHLAGKSWITTQHIHIFIEKISKYKNIEIPDKQIDKDTK